MEPLREREATLVRIVSALHEVSGTAAWSSLKTEIFDGVVVKLEKELLDEAKKDSPDLLKLSSLKGQYVWAKKYADLDGLAAVFNQELINVRKQLYGGKTPK